MQYSKIEKDLFKSGYQIDQESHEREPGESGRLIPHYIQFSKYNQIKREFDQVTITADSTKAGKPGKILKIWYNDTLQYERGKSTMQKSSYYIIQRTGKEITKKMVNGYTVTDDETGLIYGVRRVNNLWQVTELSTGLLCSKSSDNINQMNKIGDYIKKISDQVKELLKARPELKKRLENASEIA